MDALTNYSVNRRNVTDAPEYFDILEDADNILIGGLKGSGKSVLIREYLTHIIEEEAPGGKYFAIFDGGRGKLKIFAYAPHTLAFKSNHEGYIHDLKYIVENIMAKRFRIMKEKGLSAYDGSSLLLVIDELSDILKGDRNEALKYLYEIALHGRECKIKLICATRLVGKEFIAPELLSLFDCRIAMCTTYGSDSELLIGDNAAAKLPIYGRCIVNSRMGKYYADIEPISKKYITDCIEKWNTKIVNTDSIPRAAKAYEVVRSEEKPVSVEKHDKADSLIVVRVILSILIFLPVVFIFEALWEAGIVGIIVLLLFVLLL